MATRGGARGGGGSRGGGGARGGRGGRGGGPGIQSGGSLHNAPALPGPNVQTVGVRRPGYGTTGRTIPLIVNSYRTKIETPIIYHYDVVIASDKGLPAKLNMELIKRLQHNVAPTIFAGHCVYDGRKNLFAPGPLPFAKGATSQEFNVTLSDAVPEGRPPKVYKIRLTEVQRINPEILKRYTEGQQSPDNAILTAITALNVVIQMQPREQNPFNARSFFTDRGKKDIGNGLEIWRGYFQSVRPGIGQMLVNVDISSAVMYKPGSLIALCLDFFGRNDANILSPARGLPDRERLRLGRFLAGVRVVTPSKDKSGKTQPPRVIKKLSTKGATQLSFRTREGTTLTVAQYFQNTQNKPLRYPDLLCVEVGSGALLPLEMCTVIPGQQMRKQLPPEKTSAMVEFSTLRPPDRLAAIREGLDVLQYGQSQYLREFGMTVEPAPLEIMGRILDTPVLKYGAGSKQLTIKPANGAWNLIDKKFYKPAGIERWVIVVYETQRRFGQPAADQLIQGIIKNCKAVGMPVGELDPLVRWENGQGNIGAQLKNAGMECNKKNKKPPTLMVVVLPEGGNEIYTAVKHFGDCTMGVATQCLKSMKCYGAKDQYLANVLLKVNVKLGGINVVPDPTAVRFLTDPTNPTLVMGADVIHPAPGADGRPSFSSLVGNVDSDTSKYIAESRVQTSKQEIIEDLQEMAEKIILKYIGYREQVEKRGAGRGAPKRLLFFRDGVSEGQFSEVLQKELAALKKACEKLKIKPTITFIVVGKRHHVRFFPKSERDGDRSGNAPAGTVVDTQIAHPSEFDFFLQSHGGLLGTSRSGHYSVLHDENKFTADGLQSLSFALCHVYARATRSVSIPAPVYYADIVCSRAKNHYDPNTPAFAFSDSATNTSTTAEGALDAFRVNFKPTHPNMAKTMYFS